MILIEVCFMNNNEQLWENVLMEVRNNISKANFSTWFKDTYIIKQEKGVVYLGVPNQFVKDWLSTKYHKFILKALRNFSDNIRELDYVISPKNKKNGEVSYNSSSNNNLNELPLSDFYVNKEDNLNPRYTFDNFVVGQFNELPYAAAQAIITKPGLSYNPLFVYGATGHGKTHLIQAIGNTIKKNDSSKKVLYVTSEKFTVDYLNAIQNTRVNSFKEKYRKYDVFIMDDVQFLSNKEKTQEELFHLFNALYDNNKQIVFSSDKHPNYIPNMENRLKSRFDAGMIVDIPVPDHESRVAILKAKSTQNKLPLSEEVIEYLALNTQGNIRELEGNLNLINCQAQVKEKDLSLSDVKELIRNNTSPKKTMSPKEVIKAVADFYNIDEKSVFEKSRRKQIVKPRQLIMFLLREDMGVSYPTIGEELGGRDHTTIIHSCEKIRKDLEKNPEFKQELEQIRSLLK